MEGGGLFSVEKFTICFLMFEPLCRCGLLSQHYHPNPFLSTETGRTYLRFVPGGSMVMDPLIELCWVLDGWDIHKWGSPVDMLLGPWITFIFSCKQIKTEQNKSFLFL